MSNNYQNKPQCIVMAFRKRQSLGNRLRAGARNRFIYLTTLCASPLP